MKKAPKTNRRGQRRNMVLKRKLNKIAPNLQFGKREAITRQGYWSEEMEAFGYALAAIREYHEGHPEWPPVEPGWNLSYESLPLFARPPGATNTDEKRRVERDAAALKYALVALDLIAAVLLTATPEGFKEIANFLRARPIEKRAIRYTPRLPVDATPDTVYSPRPADSVEWLVSRIRIEALTLRPPKGTGFIDERTSGARASELSPAEIEDIRRQLAPEVLPDTLSHAIARDKGIKRRPGARPKPRDSGLLPPLST